MNKRIKYLVPIILFLFVALIARIGAIGSKNNIFSVQNITVKSRQHFTVELKSNPTTGYSWGLFNTTDKKYIRLISSKYTAGEKRLFGSGGVETWEFKAYNKGRTSIMFRYQRPWEKDKSPREVKKFIININ